MSFLVRNTFDLLRSPDSDSVRTLLSFELEKVREPVEPAASLRCFNE